MLSGHVKSIRARCAQNSNKCVNTVRKHSTFYNALSFADLFHFFFFLKIFIYLKKKSPVCFYTVGKNDQVTKLELLPSLAYTLPFLQFICYPDQKDNTNISKSCRFTKKYLSHLFVISSADHYVTVESRLTHFWLLFKPASCKTPALMSVLYMHPTQALIMHAAHFPPVTFSHAMGAAQTQEASQTAASNMLLRISFLSHISDTLHIYYYTRRSHKVKSVIGVRISIATICLPT